MMLRVKTVEMRRMAVHALSGLVMTAGLLAGTTRALAQNKLGPAAPVSYDNRYELYGGANFMNFQAGQTLPNRMNLAGGEVLGTYYVTRNLGIGADYRFEAGTTPVLPNPTVHNRPLVYMNALMGGAQYRGPKNHYAAISYHGYFGVSHGTFDYSTQSLTPQAFQLTGLYTNRTKPMGAFGGSVDFNRSKNLAVRISPDLIIEHFGTETREFFAISGGVIYRFGRR